MLRSIATVSLGGTLSERLQAIAAARFDCVEIFHADLENFPGSPRDVRTIASDLGLKIVAYQPLRDFEGVPTPALREHLERAARMFEVALELGAPLVGLCSNTSPQTIPDDERAAQQLHELALSAARCGLRVGYEALAWGAHVNTYAHAWRIVDRAAHPNLGLIVDSFHTLVIGDDHTGIAAIPGDRIFLAQVADAPRLRMGFISWSRHFRCFPGHGDLDVAGFVRSLMASGYRGPFSLEIFNDRYQRALPHDTARDGVRSLRELIKQVRARSEEHAFASHHS